MAYSAALIKEVKELYPDSSAIHELADNGGAFLGRYLDDSCPRAMSLDEILTSISLDELQAKARIYKRKIALYAKWCDEDPRPKIG